MAKKKESRRPLSTERILREAVTYADENGLASLSMRRLGERLGVEAMSLYNHVANKDAILDGMVEEVIAGIELPADGAHWKAAMRGRAVSAHATLVRHPWAGSLIVGRVNAGPSMLRYVEATLASLRGAGFALEMADHAWNAMDSYIYGFTLQELNFPFEPDEYAGAAEEYLPQLPADRYPHLVQLSGLVASGAYDGVHAFEFGFDLLLDGLEKLLGDSPGACA